MKGHLEACLTRRQAALRRRTRKHNVFSMIQWISVRAWGSVMGRRRVPPASCTRLGRTFRRSLGNWCPCTSCAVQCRPWEAAGNKPHNSANT